MSTPDKDNETYTVREVVGRFDDTTQFEDAIESVEKSGTDRAAINMMASHDAVKAKLGHRYESIAEFKDTQNIPRQLFADRHERAEGRAAAMGIPMYIGGAGAGMAVVASGGTLAFAALIAAAGAAAGAGIGSLAALAISKQQADSLSDHLSSGGLLLWVEVRDEEHEKEVISILEKAGGQDVRALSITRSWGTDDIPLHDFNPDPLLR
ncbi:MAG: hypothetical protein CMN56_14855 [Sneathiella sp.]|uniref:hypothetical protein n=1 Tax=Sneathiella sp. TaxID=1964365 RepID=UPI000C3D6BA1|nr:hypothetical protein [Sneathiella sp.]MAZ04410.1 hypothetical protein [Sneathiella sp.]